MSDGQEWTLPELQPRAIRLALQQIEYNRARCSGKAPKRNPRKRSFDGTNLNRAFARASAEQLELRELRASGKPYACLEFQIDGTPARVSDRPDAGTADGGA